MTAGLCLQSPVNAILKVIIGILDQTKADSVKTLSGQGPYICCQVLDLKRFECMHAGESRECR